jgi:phenylalanyl-tRNA synthetase alpha subunit
MDARILIFGLAAAASAVDTAPPLPGHTDERHETHLIDPLTAKEQKKDLLRFQAEERKIFYDDLSVEKKRVEAEWAAKSKELLEKQREARRAFQPEQHTVEERRGFYLSQRHEMAEFRKEKDQALKTMNGDQKAKREEFHKRQAADRKAANP